MNTYDHTIDRLRWLAGTRDVRQNTATDQHALKRAARILAEIPEREEALIKIILNGSPFADLPRLTRIDLAHVLNVDCLSCADGYFDTSDQDECVRCRESDEEARLDGLRQMRAGE